MKWILCIILSAVIHLLCIYGVIMNNAPKKKIQTIPVNVAVEQAPAEPDVQQTAPEQKPKSQKQSVTQAQKYQPNAEYEKSDKTQTADYTPEADESELQDSVADLSEDALAESRPEPEENTPVSDPEYTKQAVKKYRRKLLGDFQDQWVKVPPLSTVIQNRSILPSIDRFFGIRIIAYGFVDQKPAAPFWVLSEDGSSFTKADSFDFSGFSNRTKDRMLSAEYKNKLQRTIPAQEKSSVMKIVGLIPISTDQYFAGKQLRAVELANVSLEKVQATVGHYESNHAEGYSLIIDAVQVTDGRTIPIQDEELRFSMTAKK